jgi:hypothetical protein
MAVVVSLPPHSTCDELHTPYCFDLHSAVLLKAHAPLLLLLLLLLQEALAGV